jgi:protein disulfide-isomerase
LELDFPKRTQIPEKYRQQNAMLQQAFGVRGYPTVWVFELNQNEETGEMQITPLGKTGYKASVSEFTDDVDKMLAAASGGS